jgi:hypothetical protein
VNTATIDADTAEKCRRLILEFAIAIDDVEEAIQ